MFAYTDETGHSGRNIFDENEVFCLGSILSVRDITKDLEEVIRPFIADREVKRLHANQWQEHELVPLAHNLVDALDVGNQWIFNIMQLHKPYIAPTKFVDLIFDPGENRAVPGGWYWDEMHRHILCLLVDDAMPTGLAKDFWDAYLKDDIGRIILMLDAIQEFVVEGSYPDPIKRVFVAAFNFARKNPDAFTMISTQKRKGYQAHSPNLVAFTQLFQAIHEFASNYDSPPQTLLHDKQDEFRSELVNSYNTFGSVMLHDAGDGKWPEASLVDYSLAKLEIVSSAENMGLQATDLLLWIHQRNSSSADFLSLKQRLSEKETPYYIGRGMSELIVDLHMRNRS